MIQQTLGTSLTCKGLIQDLMEFFGQVSPSTQEKKIMAHLAVTRKFKPIDTHPRVERKERMGEERKERREWEKRRKEATDEVRQDFKKRKSHQNHPIQIDFFSVQQKGRWTKLFWSLFQWISLHVYPVDEKRYSKDSFVWPFHLKGLSILSQLSIFWKTSQLFLSFSAKVLLAPSFYKLAVAFIHRHSLIQTFIHRHLDTKRARKDRRKKVSNAKKCDHGE